MDEDRIERALRDGPPGEPAYVPALAFRHLDGSQPPASRVVRSGNRAGALVRVIATVLVAVLVVAALIVIRSEATPEQLPVAAPPAASFVPAPSASLSASASAPATATATAAPSPTQPGAASPSVAATASAAAPPSSPAAIEEVGNATAIAVGVYHTCALTRTAGVKCWGFNNAGQLGNGSQDTSAAPVDVVGLTSGVRAIAAAALQTCALTTSGGVKCWGSNTYGQLGTGDYHNSSVPVDVAGLTKGVVAVSVGDGHVCAITTGGGVKCWGGYCGCEGIGVLGDGTEVSSATPVDVKGLSSGVTALAAGKNHTCALKGDGSVVCWGDNVAGQLGDGTTTPGVVPVRVIGLTGPVTSIDAGGNRTCAIAGGNTVCWGSAAGHDASGGTTDSSRPVAVPGVGSMTAFLKIGTFDSCVIDDAGAATCWGPNEHGQLGDGSRAVRVAPVRVTGLAGSLVAIAPGDSHVCAVTTRGAVECWGNNADGQLGVGVPKGIGSSSPVAVPGL